MSLEASIFGGGMEGDAVVGAGPMVGARVLFSPISLVGAELGYSATFTDLTTRSGQFGTEKSTEDKLLQHIFASGVLNLSDTMVTPFLTAGVGMVIMDDVDFAWHLGMGVRYFLNDFLGFRADFQGIFSPGAPAEDDFGHFTLTASIIGRFGFGSKDSAPARKVEKIDEAPKSDEAESKATVNKKIPSSRPAEAPKAVEAPKADDDAAAPKADDAEPAEAESAPSEN